MQMMPSWILPHKLSHITWQDIVVDKWTLMNSLHSNCFWCKYPMQKPYEKQCKIISCLHSNSEIYNRYHRTCRFWQLYRNYKVSNVFYLLNIYCHHIFLFYHTFTCNCDTQTYHMTSTCILIYKTTIIYNSDIKSFWYK